MPFSPSASTGVEASSGASRMRRSNKSALLTLCLGWAIVWASVSLLGRNFVGAWRRSEVSPSLRRSDVGGGLASRRAYDFGFAEDEGHQDLMIQETEDGAKRISTVTQGDWRGHWNTVLADKEIPAKGRSYFEVKIVSKNIDAWEFIGLAEKGAEPLIPLHKQKKAKVYGSIGSTWSDTMFYTHLEPDKKWNTDLKKEIEDKWMKNIPAWLEDQGKDVPNEKILKQAMQDETKERGALWSGSGVVAGYNYNEMPAFEPGLVIGVDVNMDEGSISYWVNGKFQKTLMDIKQDDKPMDLKGKKLFPAFSVFGRDDLDGNAINTVMEVRTGLEPPTIDEKADDDHPHYKVPKWALENPLPVKPSWLIAEEAEEAAYAEMLEKKKAEDEALLAEKMKARGEPVEA